MSTLNTIKSLVKKDFLFERVIRRIYFIILPFICLSLLWAKFNGAASTVMLSVSFASQAFGAFVIFNFPLLPFLVYLYLIQGERRTRSFMTYFTLPIDRRVLFWGRVLTCWLFCLIPTATAYITLIMLHYVFPSRDLLENIYLTPSFVLFTLSLSWLTSILAIGLAINLDPKSLPIFASITGMLLVMIPFVFSQRVAGMDAQVLVIQFIQSMRTFTRAALFITIASLILGVIFSTWFSNKRSYV